MRCTALWIGAIAATTACSDSKVVVGGLEEIAMFRTLPNRNLDILFVIDDSPSMGDKQDQLAANFPLMIDALSELDGTLPNVHIGVVTTDMGTMGTADPNPGPAIGTLDQGGCAGAGKDGQLQTTNAMTDAWLSDVEVNGARVRNYTGDLHDAFATLAKQGARGCGFEQPLHAMRRALVNPANAGFLRDDANLAVVFIGDEDDCSVAHPEVLGTDTATFGPLQSFRCTKYGLVCDQSLDTVGDKTNCAPDTSAMWIDDPTPYVDDLMAAKNGDRRMIMVGAIIGDQTPVATELAPPPGGGNPIESLTHSCSYVDANGFTEVADPGVRLSWFAGQFNGASTSICSPHLVDPIQTIGQSAKHLMGASCVDMAGVADASPDPGLQPSCDISFVSDSKPDLPVVVPPCTTGANDCYDVVVDAARCPEVAGNTRLDFHFATPPPADAWTHVRCARQD